MSTPEKSEVERSRVGWRIGVFLVLVVLAVMWPAPVIWLNEAGPGVALSIGEESFLGREAPEWDVVFWWIAGLFAIVLGRSDPATYRRGLGRLRQTVVELPGNVSAFVESTGPVRLTLAVAGLFMIPVLVAVSADPLVLRGLIAVDQSSILDLTSSINRFGGGVVPALTAVFILLVGIATNRESWIRLFVVLAAASIVSSALLQMVKLVGRARPEIFVGPLWFRPGIGESFPSGHTLAVFIVACGVAFFSRSRTASVLVLAAAAAVAATRVLTFRHWPSDVIFSALLGLGSVHVFFRALFHRDETLSGSERNQVR